MIATHGRILLPQAVDPDRVVKALQLRQSVSKNNNDTHTDLPPLEARYWSCGFSQMEIEIEVKQKCCHKGVSIEEIEGR